MAAASATAEKAPRSRAPHVNLSDMPELMPGAQPSANPTQREQFEQRCRKLHRDEISEEQQERQAADAVTRVAGAGAARSSDLEAMFPMLDPALVRTLYAEALSPQHAIETLLALSAASAEPVAGTVADAKAGPGKPPWQLGVEDETKFPSLVDGGGWQVASQRQIERDPDEDLGSAWRDRAKTAVDIPGPPPGPRPALVTESAQALRRRTRRSQDDGMEPLTTIMTDYEYRHRVGQMRAKHRQQYGRGRLGAAAQKAATRGKLGGGRGAGGPEGSGESEASEDGDGQ